MNTISANRNNVTSKQQVDRLKSAYGQRRKGLGAELSAKQKALQIYESERLQVLTVEPELCTAGLLYRAIEVSGTLR